MTRIEELEREIELTKELIELQRQLNAMKSAPPINPHTPHPYAPSPSPPWFYPTVWYMTAGGAQ